MWLGPAVGPVMAAIINIRLAVTGGDMKSEGREKGHAVYFDRGSR